MHVLACFGLFGKSSEQIMNIHEHILNTVNIRENVTENARCHVRICQIDRTVRIHWIWIYVRSKINWNARIFVRKNDGEDHWKSDPASTSCYSSSSHSLSWLDDFAMIFQDFGTLLRPRAFNFSPGHGQRANHGQAKRSWRILLGKTLRWHCCFGRAALASRWPDSVVECLSKWF